MAIAFFKSLIAPSIDPVETMVELGKKFEATFKDKTTRDVAIKALKSIEYNTPTPPAKIDDAVENFILAHQNEIKTAHANRYEGFTSFKSAYDKSTVIGKRALYALAEANIKIIVTQHAKDKAEFEKSLAEEQVLGKDMFESMDNFWFGEKNPAAIEMK